MSRQPKSGYKILDTFNITGRGLVLVGVLEGDASVGDTIEFPFEGKLLQLTIKGIEMPRITQEYHVQKTAFMVACTDNELKALHSWQPDGRPAVIY